MNLRVHKPYVIAEEGDHLFIWLGLDEADAEKGILTNQYLIIDSYQGMLIDPGGYFVFERVYEAVSEFIRPENIVGIFFSHQDPDVIGSLNLLIDMFPNAKLYVSSLWVRFLPHLGAISGLNMIEIPDEGREIHLGKARLKAIPAHFLHSPGTFTLYDPIVKTLFSSDIGAAVFPRNKWYLFVEDFNEHVRYIEWFHKRYMACRKALLAWLKHVKHLDINIIAPQHGAIFVNENAKKFLQWLESLEPVGIDYIYRRHDATI